MADVGILANRPRGSRWSADEVCHFAAPASLRLLHDPWWHPCQPSECHCWMGDARIAPDAAGGCYVNIEDEVTYVSPTGQQISIEARRPQTMHLSRCGTLLTLGYLLDIHRPAESMSEIRVRRITDASRPHGKVVRVHHEECMVNGAITEELCDGRQYLIIANQSNDESLRIIDLETGYVRAVVAGGDFFNNASVSPNGRWIGSVGDKAVACFWEVVDRREDAIPRRYSEEHLDERSPARAIPFRYGETESGFEQKPLSLVLRRTADLFSLVNNGCLDFTHDSRHYILASRNHGVFWGSLYGTDALRMEDYEEEKAQGEEDEVGVWENRRWTQGEWWERVFAKRDTTPHCFAAASPKEPAFFACSDDGIGTVLQRTTMAPTMSRAASAEMSAESLDERDAQFSFLEGQEEKFMEEGWKTEHVATGGKNGVVMMVKVKNYRTPHAEVSWAQTQGMHPRSKKEGWFLCLAVAPGGWYLWVAHPNGLQRYTISPPLWTEISHVRFPKDIRRLVRAFFYAISRQQLHSPRHMWPELILSTASYIHTNFGKAEPDDRDLAVEPAKPQAELEEMGEVDIAVGFQRRVVP
eukprot:Hpha_TRINITY_DN10930_c0_g2::TRINITY_DN10930_c0_g2_i1::g.26995::m.26995